MYGYGLPLLEEAGVDCVGIGSKEALWNDCQSMEEEAGTKKEVLRLDLVGMDVIHWLTSVVFPCYGYEDESFMSVDE